jgi:hypothetical protein
MVERERARVDRRGHCYHKIALACNTKIQDKTINDTRRSIVDKEVDIESKGTVTTGPIFLHVDWLSKYILGLGKAKGDQKYPKRIGLSRCVSLKGR